MFSHSGNQLLDPHLIFEKAHLEKGMHVAIFGCGRTGHLVYPSAMLVGHRGAVYAVDIMKDVLEGVRKQSDMDGFTNVHTVWSDVEWIGMTAVPEKSLDIVFLVNVLIHIQKHEAAMIEAARLLKDKGRIVVADWVDTTAFRLPYRKKVDFPELVAWAQKNNFAVQEEFAAGKYHQGLVLFRHE